MTLPVTQSGKIQVSSLCLTSCILIRHSILITDFFIYISNYTEFLAGTEWDFLLFSPHKPAQCLAQKIMAKYTFVGWLTHQNLGVIMGGGEGSGGEHPSRQKKRQNADDSKQHQNQNCFLSLHQHLNGSALPVIYWPSFQAWGKKYHISVGFLTLILFEREPTPLTEVKYNSPASWKQLSHKFLTNLVF